MEFRRLDISGTDSHDFAHRMFSRNIRTLAVGHGALSLFLSAEGRVESMFWAIKTKNEMILLVPTPLAQKTYDLIERYHFSEKFETRLEDVIYGQWTPYEGDPRGIGKLNTEASIFEGQWRGTHFKFALIPNPPTPNDRTAWLRHRIENVIPSFPQDFDSSTLVFDSGLEDLCDADKGCYIGQEVVERVRTRAGGGPRILTSLTREGTLVGRSEVFGDSGESIGHFTDSVLHENGKTLGLALIKRSAKT